MNGPEFYKRIPQGIETTNSAEDRFIWTGQFTTLVCKEINWKKRDGFIGVRDEVAGGARDFISASPKIVDAAARVMRRKGFKPQRHRNS